MLSLNPETQLRLYSLLRTLEPRFLALESHVGQLKRTCVHGGPSSVPNLVASAAEVKWQLNQLMDLSLGIEELLGVSQGSQDRGNAGPAPQAAEVQAGEGGPPAGEVASQSDSSADRPEPPGFRGTTDVIGVPDLVSTLDNLNKTGTLALHENDTMFVFEFQEGKVVHAITNKQSSEMRLGTILMAQNTITEQQLAESLDASAAAEEPLGAHLVTTATVSEEDLRSALDAQVQMIFGAAFELQCARFTFLEGSLSNLAQRTAVSTTELLLEAARRMDQDVHEGRLEPACATRGAIDSILGDG